MDSVRGRVIIRKAAEEDALPIARICVEDWQKAYRGIIDSDLSKMSLLRTGPVHRFVSVGMPFVTRYDNTSTTCPVVHPCSSMSDWTLAMSLCHMSLPVVRSSFSISWATLNMFVKN